MRSDSETQGVKSQHSIVEEEIYKLLEKGVIKVSSPEPGEFISSIFLRPKPDGSHRVILNLKQFNEFVEYYHFKMDTLEKAIKMMKPVCFMASIDLKDAYYTVPVHPSHQKYLKFIFNGTRYQYTCLPNGLSSAPRIFTKLMKPGYALLHSQGYLSLGNMMIHICKETLMKSVARISQQQAHCLGNWASIYTQSNQLLTQRRHWSFWGFYLIPRT